MRSAEIARRVLLSLCLADAIYTAAQCQHVFVRHVLRSWPRRCAVWAAPPLRGLGVCCMLSTLRRSRGPLPNPALKRTASGGRLASRWAPPVRILASISRASSGHFGALGRDRSARSTKPLPHGCGLHGCPMPTRLCSPRPAPLAPLLRGLGVCCMLSTLRHFRRPLPNPTLKRTASGGRLAPR